jgi:carboxyl-terminal processing protease
MKKFLLSGLVLLGLVLQSQAQVKSPAATTEKFAMLLNYIEHYYVDSVNSAELTEKAIVSLLENLDPHSSYFTAEEMQDSNEPLQGSFSGIGVSFNLHKDTIFIVEPIAGGPSEKLGIKAGDKIVEVNGEKVAGIGIKNSDVTSKLRGPKGTTVRVGIQRKGVKNIIPYDIVRADIPIYSIDAAYMVTPTVGYVKVARFAKTTMEELRKALTTLKSQGMKTLVLDLQGNGGGLLNTAVEMADEFLSGDKLLVYTEGRSFPRKEDHADPNKTGLFEKGKLIILVDESSASASEIVSGAIQDWDRGLIVGRRSFGKGLVQRQMNLTDGSSIRLTVQRYFTPSGRCIQKSYEDGLEDYYKDSEKRFKNGEYFSQDSIQFPDSLKYYTNIKKRVVYGGGGIMPDVFVPIDTTENSDYFFDLIRVGVFNEWALEYVDANRESLKQQYPTAEAFIKGYSVSEGSMQEIFAKGAKEEVPFNEAQYKISERVMKIRVKAMVARDLYNNEAFYRVINDLNLELKKALEVIENGTFDKMKLAYSEK